MKTYVWKFYPSANGVEFKTKEEALDAQRQCGGAVYEINENGEKTRIK